MKRIILLLTIVAMCTNLFGQQPSTTTLNKDYYLQKSRAKKQTGWILLGAGTAAIVAGAIGFSSTFDLSGSGDAYGFLFLAGLISDISSIPFFISAGHYKKLAAEVVFRKQPVYLTGQYITARYSIPAVSLKISF